MLAFAVYAKGRLADKVNLAGAYVIGTDDVPLRAEIAFKSGIITCRKRAAGPAGIALLWEIEGAGTILVETIRVQERDKPYILQLELARGRLMRLTHKLEDWGLTDFDEAADLVAKVAEARDILVEALQAEDPAHAAELGDKALSKSVLISEELSRFHALAFIARRKQTGGFTKRMMGCGAPMDKSGDAIKKRLTSAFDFATIPLAWRDIEPTEQNFNWKNIDAWVETLAKQNFPLRGSSLLSFNVRNVPDWLYIWEHDFDTIRDLAFEHVRRVLNRYGQHMQSWTVVSGIHAPNCFAFSFEQLIELTRMATALTKQLSPRGLTLIELCFPWGEYYARNQRTIPPLLYADMVVQSGINFDAFGVQFIFGPAVDGMFVRDIFQISAMLDSLSKLGKPIHITGVQAPSEIGSARAEASEGIPTTNEGGAWHGQWSEEIQSEWTRRFYEVALSKVFVESINWLSLADYARQPVPNGGLLRSDGSPKAAFQQITTIRSDLLALAPRPQGR